MINSRNKEAINPLLFLVFLAIIKSSDAVSGNPTSYKIGGVLSNNASQQHFKKTIDVSLKILNISLTKKIYFYNLKTYLLINC